MKSWSLHMLYVTSQSTHATPAAKSSDDGNMSATMLPLSALFSKVTNSILALNSYQRWISFFFASVKKFFVFISKID